MRTGYCRLLDTLVAKRVMGYEVGWTNTCQNSMDQENILFNTRDNFSSPMVLINGQWKEVKCYSTDLEAAWDIINKLLEQGCSFDIKISNPKCYQVTAYSPVTDLLHSFSSESLPLSICVTALLAVGVSEIELMPFLM